MVSIVRFAGTNCEFDMRYVYENLLHIPSAIIWHKERVLPSETKLVVLAGGFSYGDYLRSGAIARFAPIMQAIREFGQKGGRILGICNGFQILTEAKLLPGALMRNQNLHFISKTTSLQIANTDNPFLKPHTQGEIISLPIAHADGRYHIDEKGLQDLREHKQILLRYVDNHNGSCDSIAGVCNKERTIFGLMPHPERACERMFAKRAAYASVRQSYQQSCANATSGQNPTHTSAQNSTQGSMQTQATSSLADKPQGLAMLESIYKA